MTRNGLVSAGGRTQVVSALSLLAALLACAAVLLPWTSTVTVLNSAHPSVPQAFGSLAPHPLAKTAYELPLAIAVVLLLAAAAFGTLGAVRWRRPTQITAVSGTGVLLGSVGAVWVAYLAEVAYPSDGGERVVPGAGLWLFLPAALIAAAAATTVTLAER